MNTSHADSESNVPPPKQALHWQKALLWHGVGFLTLVVLTWCDALFDLMHYILGHAARPANIMEVEIKTVVILLLWIGSAYKLYQIVSRLSYLEKFLHVCSWCRRIQHQNFWLSLEEHFQHDTGGEVSHGICPECARRFKEENDLQLEQNVAV
jgi:hypothetical protein